MSCARSSARCSASLFIELTRRRLGHGDAELHFGALRGADAKKALLIVGVMTVHSFTEGVGVGVSFGGGEALGAFITAAIAVHNIPEGLAISLVLVPRGVTAWRGGRVEHLLEPAAAAHGGAGVPARRVVRSRCCPSGSASPAARWCGWSRRSSCPEAREDLSARAVAGVVALAMGVMILFQLLVLA